LNYLNVKVLSAVLHIKLNDCYSGGISELTEGNKTGEEEGNPHPNCYDHLTPAERRYMEQKQKIDMQKMAKVANKSHRDHIQDFNQHLANLSEHYDIPKVGPG
jgi:protein FAM32A